MKLIKMEIHIILLINWLIHLDAFSLTLLLLDLSISICTIAISAIVSYTIYRIYNYVNRI